MSGGKYNGVPLCNYGYSVSNTFYMFAYFHS